MCIDLWKFQDNLVNIESSRPAKTKSETLSQKNKAPNNPPPNTGTNKDGMTSYTAHKWQWIKNNMYRIWREVYMKQSSKYTIANLMRANN